jgi:hypothetical protein
VYIADIGDAFRHGLERAFTDLYPIVTAQEYIEEFRLCLEPLSVPHGTINVSEWRNSPFLGQANLFTIYNHMFGVPWSIEPCLKMKIDEQYKDCVLLHCSCRRLPSLDLVHKIIDAYKTKISFVSENPHEYEAFCQTFGARIPIKHVSSLYELVVAIASCKLFVGNLSSPLAIAHNLHKDNLTLLSPSNSSDDIHCKNMSIYNLSIRLLQ